MCTTSIFAILTTPNDGISPNPLRALACTVTPVTLAAGCFVPLHSLGILGLLSGLSTITPATVVASSTLGVIISVACAAKVRLASSREERGGPSMPESGAQKLLVALTGIPYIALFLNSFWSFPNGYDAIAYHVDIALKWLQHGTIQLSPAWGWKYSLPSNGELPALVVLSLGLPRAVAFDNIFETLLLATSVYLIAWRMTRNATAALLAAIVPTTIPMVIYQTFQLYVDLFGTSFLIATVALFIWRDGNPPMLNFLSGYAAGIAAGSKPVFWGYCVVSLLPLSSVSSNRNRKF